MSSSPRSSLSGYRDRPGLADRRHDTTSRDARWLVRQESSGQGTTNGSADRDERGEGYQGDKRGVHHGVVEAGDLLVEEAARRRRYATMTVSRMATSPGRSSDVDRLQLFRIFSFTTRWDSLHEAASSPELPGGIASAASGMWDGINDAFRGAVNWIIGKWNDLQLTIGGGNFDLPGPLGSVTIPSMTLSTPNIPMLAKGGTALQPASPSSVRVGRSSPTGTVGRPASRSGVEDAAALRR